MLMCDLVCCFLPLKALYIVFNSAEAFYGMKILKDKYTSIH